MQWKVNMDSLIKTLLLAGSTISLFSIIYTDELVLFIHPRFNIGAEIAAYTLAVLTCIQATRIITIPHRHSHSATVHHSHFNYLACFAFATVLSAGVFLPNKTLDAKLVSNKGLNTRLNPEFVYADQSMPRPLAAQLRNTNVIEVNDSNYIEVMSELNLFPRDYLGKEIHLTGFVFRDGHMPSDELAIARFVVVCCLADAAPYGLLCESSDATAYNSGAWLDVQGVLEMTAGHEKIVPILKITSAKVTKQPAKPYVYLME